jgi:hypothetical protein
MASNHNHSGGQSAGGNAAGRRAPDWADGLKQLYDSVVEEDLPDSFKNLLNKLDQLDNGGASPGSNDNRSASSDDRGPRR